MERRIGKRLPALGGLVALVAFLTIPRPALGDPELVCSYRANGVDEVFVYLNPANIVEEGYAVGFFERTVVAAVSAWNMTGWDFALTYAGTTTATTPAADEIIVRYRDYPECTLGWVNTPLSCEGKTVNIARHNATCADPLWGDTYPDAPEFGGSVQYYIQYRDLLATLVHEIGHALGFEHASDAVASVMADGYTTSSLETNRYPSARDQHQLRHALPPKTYGTRQGRTVHEMEGPAGGAWLPSVYDSGVSSSWTPGIAKALEPLSSLAARFVRMVQHETQETIYAERGTGCGSCWESAVATSGWPAHGVTVAHGEINGTESFVAVYRAGGDFAPSQDYRIFYMTSPDGVTWSEPALVSSSIDRDVRTVATPAIAFDGSKRQFVLVYPSFTKGRLQNGGSLLCTASYSPLFDTWANFFCPIGEEQWDTGKPYRALGTPALSCIPESAFCDIAWTDTNRGEHQRFAGVLFWNDRAGHYSIFGTCLGPVPTPGPSMRALDSAWVRKAWVDHLRLAQPRGDGSLDVLHKSGTPMWGGCWDETRAASVESWSGGALVYDEGSDVFRLYFSR